MSKSINLNTNIAQEIEARIKLLDYLPNATVGISDGSYSVYEFEGFTAVNKPYEFHITFISDNKIDIEEIVDTNIELTIIDVKRPLLNKQIFAMIYKATEDSIVASKYMYKIHVVSPAYYMQLNTSYEIFLDKKVPDIISEIVNRYTSLLNIKLNMKIDPSKAPVREYTTRYKQSSLEFITMLCEEEGYCLLIDYSSNEPYTMTLCELNDHVTVHKEPLSANYNKIKQFSSSHSINNFYDEDKPSLDMQIKIGNIYTSSLQDNPSTSQLREDIKNYSQKDTLHTYDESLFKDLKRYSNNDSLKGFAQSFSIHGTSVELNISDSILVTLHDEKRLRQCEVITLNVNYHGSFPNALDEFVQDGNHTIQFYTNFEAIPSDIIYKPQITIQKPKITGTLSAIVSKGKDDPTQNINEIDVDEQGRIRVLFHFEENKATSTYLKMMQPYAGDNYGFMFLPRVNTEVLVGFKNGNPSEPFILRTIPNGENKHPYPLPTNKSKSFIRTTSYPAYEDTLGYNELLFEDKKEAELFSLRAQRDFEIYAKNDFSQKIDNNSDNISYNTEETVKHNYTQSVGKIQNRTIKADDIKTVQNEAQTQTQIEATEGITLRCGVHVLTIDNAGIHFNTSCYLDNSGNDGVVAGGVKITGGRIMQGVNREQD